MEISKITGNILLMNFWSHCISGQFTMAMIHGQWLRGVAIAYYPMTSPAHHHTCFSSKHPTCQLPQLYSKVSTPAAFNSTLLSPPCIVGSTRLSFHGFVGPGRGICGSVFGLHSMFKHSEMSLQGNPKEENVSVYVCQKNM